MSTKLGEKSNTIIWTYAYTDPDKIKKNISKINDLIILPRINIMIISNNNKKIYIFDIRRNVHNHIIKRDNEITCFSCL